MTKWDASPNFEKVFNPEAAKKEKRYGIFINASIDFSWIAIDLGTTHSCAAYAKKGISDKIAGVNVDVIPINMENGSPILPSVVKI